MCAYGTEIKTTEHFSLCCHFYTTQTELYDSIFFNLNEKDQVNTLLHGSQTNDSKYIC